MHAKQQVVKFCIKDQGQREGEVGTACSRQESLPEGDSFGADQAQVGVRWVEGGRKAFCAGRGWLLK